jgi:DNA-binding MarR family transcriptional regulator
MARSVLQEELRKKKPFDLPEQEAALNLARTHDYLVHESARLLEGHGISGPQYNVLRILRGHGGDGLPCTEIASQMVTRTPDITRLVDRLEAAALVLRQRKDKDRRVVRVQITPAGLDLLARLDQPVLYLHKELLGHLTRAELAELNRLLVKARRPG